MIYKDLKEKRKKANLTQEELAERLGVDRRTIINYEKGNIIPESKVKLLHFIFNETIAGGDIINRNSNVNLENIGMGNDNNITINNGNKEKEGEIQEKYDDNNDDIICILKKQLQEKDEQIKLLLDIIKNR